MIVCNFLFDRDHLLFCKSGILIFIFAENNHLVRQYICTPCWLKHLCSTRTWVPVSFFLSVCLLSLSLYFWLIPWSADTHWVHFLVRASKTLLRRRTVPSLTPHSSGRPVPTCSSVSPKNRALLAFRVNQGISASFSLLLSYRRLRTTRFWSIKEPTLQELVMDREARCAVVHGAAKNWTRLSY